MKTTTMMFPDKAYYIVTTINSYYAMVIIENGYRKMVYVHLKHFEGFTQCLNMLGFELMTKEQLGL